MSSRMQRWLRAVSDPASVRVAASAVGRSLMAAERRDRKITPISPRSALKRATDAEALIPKIVYQTWKSRNVIPANYAYWRSTFADHNPDYALVLWDDADNRQFVTDRFPALLGAYDSYPREIFRADIIRLMFLYTFGGFYADMDTECVRSLDALRGAGDVVLGRMGRDPAFDHSIPNAIMASKPRQGFWLLALSFAFDRLEAPEIRKTDFTSVTGPEYLTGPILLKDAAEFYLEHGPEAAFERVAARFGEETAEQAQYGRITLLEPESLYPIDWNNPLHRILIKRMSAAKQVIKPREVQRLFMRSFMVTYWSHSW